MKKKFPELTSDEAAEQFLETVDLSKYDFSGFKPVRFEFDQKFSSSRAKRGDPS